MAHCSQGRLATTCVTLNTTCIILKQCSHVLPLTPCVPHLVVVLAVVLK